MEATTSDATWAEVKRLAGDVREHWNKTRAKNPLPGDSLLGNKIGALFEAIEEHDKSRATQ